MCIFCGLGIYPWLAYSSCNHKHEVYPEEHNVRQNQGSGALKILKERYAKGELTTDQFLEMRKIIEQ